MTCHTVSADGSTIVSGGGTYGGSYDLQHRHADGLARRHVGLRSEHGGQLGRRTSSGRRPRCRPTGKYVLTNSMAQNGVSDYERPEHGFMGLFTTANGMPVATSGVQGSARSRRPRGRPTGSPRRVRRLGRSDRRGTRPGTTGRTRRPAT